MLTLAKKTSVLGLLAVGALIVGSVEASTTCIKSTFYCSSTTTLSGFDGEPTILCPSADAVIEIVSSAECPGGSAGPVTVLRCSSYKNGFSYTGGGYTHQFKPVHGTWGDVANDCDRLSYITAP